MSIQTERQPDGQSQTPPHGVSAIFTGPASAGGSPPMALPTGRMLAGGLAGAVLMGAAAGAIILATKGADPARLTVTGVGVLCGWVASGGAILALRPWRPRPEGRWPFALLGAQAISCVAALFLAGLLYSATPLDPVSLALSTAGGFIGAWVGQVRVFSAQFQARRGR